MKQTTNNIIPDPKKNLMLIIVMAVCTAIVMGVMYFFTGDIKYIAVEVIAMVPLIFYAVHAFFKEKRQDKRSEKDKRDFLNGAKYRQSEWKNAYYQYKETHPFETINKKGMICDLKKRYRSQNFWIIRVGILLMIGSIFILSISMTEPKDKVAAFFGILFGALIFATGLFHCTGGSVQKFMKQQADLDEIEKSYVKGKMLSFGDNGINIGSNYIVIYTMNGVYAIHHNNIQDLTRKMVRVKQYENNLYSGQEYRYYVSLIYTASGGKKETLDVRLDEFQCEMMIEEFNRRFYHELKQDSTALEITENSVSP